MSDAEARTIALALQILADIAEDPFMRPSYRAAARRHLRRLRAPDSSDAFVNLEAAEE